MGFLSPHLNSHHQSQAPAETRSQSTTALGTSSMSSATRVGSCRRVQCDSCNNKIVRRMPSASVVSWWHDHARSSASQAHRTPTAVPLPRFSNPQFKHQVGVFSSSLENHARTTPKRAIHLDATLAFPSCSSCGYLGEWETWGRRKAKGFVDLHTLPCGNPGDSRKVSPCPCSSVRSAPHVAISVGDGAPDRLHCRKLSASFLLRSRDAGGVHGNLEMAITTDQMGWY